MSPSDIHMVRRAVREGWNIPQSKRAAIVDDTVAAALDEESARMALAGAKALFEMTRHNQRLDVAELYQR